MEGRGKPFTGIGVPKGMPEGVTQKLREVSMQVMEDEDFQKLLQRVGESFDPKHRQDFRPEAGAW